MAQYGFGLGSVNVIPSTTPFSPIQIGVLKDLSFDISFTNKELRGAIQFPVDIARAEGKVSGKVKMAQLFANTIASVLGVTPTANSTTYGVYNEAAVVPTTPFQLIGTKKAVGNVGGSDLGVYDVTAGKWLSLAVSAVAGVSYTFAPATCTYTFAAGDVAHAVLLNYTIVDSNTNAGFTTSLTNQLMGSGNTYSLTAFNTFRAKTYGVKLYAVTIPKLTLSSKQSDYMDIDMDFDAFADASGKVIDIYTVE